MKKNLRSTPKILHISLLTLGLTAAAFSCTAEEKNAAGNMRIEGTLVAQPCIVTDENSNLKLDFGSIVEKSLYLHERTGTRPFSMFLDECDLSIGKTVRVSFNGTKSSALPELLAVNTSGGTSGFAIGIETIDGTPVPLGKDTSAYLLKPGSNEIIFKAYLQGEPEAVSKQSIVLGPFTAVTTFSLEYE